MHVTMKVVVLNRSRNSAEKAHTIVLLLGPELYAAGVGTATFASLQAEFSKTLVMLRDLPFERCVWAFSLSYKVNGAISLVPTASKRSSGIVIMML